MTHIIELLELLGEDINGRTTTLAYGVLSSSDPSARLVTPDDIVRFIDHGEISDSFHIDRRNNYDLSFTSSIRRGPFYADECSLTMAAPANRDLIAAWLYHRDEWVKHLKMPLVILPDDDGPSINVIHDGHYVVKNCNANSDETLDHLPDKYEPNFQTFRRMEIPHTYTPVMYEGLQIHVPGCVDWEEWDLSSGQTVELMRGANCSTFRIAEYCAPYFSLSTESVSDEIGKWCDSILTATSDMCYDDSLAYCREHMREFDFEEVYPGIWVRWNPLQALPNILL